MRSPRLRPPLRNAARAAALTLALLLGACASVPPSTPPTTVEPVAVAPSRGELLARDDRYAVVVVQPGDDLASVAQRHLGSAERAWWIAQWNGIERVKPGDVVVVPLKPPSPSAVGPQGFQTVPILTYHRFGTPKRKLSVTRADFEAQMEYLARNGYRVVPMSALIAFLEGREALPPKSVVVTIDDGYKSTYEIAYPVLRKYGFPATVYLYTDFVGAGDAMTWAQMQEMVRSGLVEIQPHSKSHGNLTLRLPNESPQQYRDRIRREVDAPIALIQDRLGLKSSSYAFPYGDVNETVVAELARAGVPMGVTVTPGGNGFFAHPSMLRRTMVFGTDDMEQFRAKLTTFARTAAR